MQITETKEILKQVALIDNRKVSQEVIEAWHRVIGAIPFDIGKEALKLAQQDASIKYLEPRHIMGWSREAAFRLDRDKPKQLENYVKVEQPICRAHGRKILACDTCCGEMGKQKNMTAAQLVVWAKQNIYA